jgi:hypothetical protein
MAMPDSGIALLISCTLGNAVGGGGEAGASGLRAPGAGDAVRLGGPLAAGDTVIFNLIFLARLPSDMIPPSRSLMFASVSDPAPATRLRIRSLGAEDEGTFAGDMGRETAGVG